MSETQRSENGYTKPQRIAEWAREQPQVGVTSLNPSLDPAWLREAYDRVRTDSAPGGDGQSVAEDGKELEENLTRLLHQRIG